MTPSTRSRGAARVPQHRTYQSTPNLRQAQFPARRTTFKPSGSGPANLRRKEGKKEREGVSAAGDDKDEDEDEDDEDLIGLNASEKRRKLRQQTLTQIDFVPRSSGQLSVVELSDSEGESQKENQVKDSDDEDNALPSSRKRRSRALLKNLEEKRQNKRRRRTLGDEVETNTRHRILKTYGGKNRRGRRKTTSDIPNAETDDQHVKSKTGFHTQTLTQLLGQRSFIKDSDDEDDNEAEDDGFQEWLAMAGVPTPPHKRFAPIVENAAPDAPLEKREPLKSAMKKNSSSPFRKIDGPGPIVPQTPAKSTRFEIPSSSQMSTPNSVMLARYGAPDAGDTTSPSQSRGKGPEVTHEIQLPDSVRPSNRVKVQGSAKSPSSTSKSLSHTRSPLKDVTVPADVTSSEAPEASTPTRRKVAAGRKNMSSKRQSPMHKTGGVVTFAGDDREIPDSDADEDEDDGKENEPPVVNALVQDESDQATDEFDAGPETQLVLNDLISSEHISTPRVLFQRKSSNVRVGQQLTVHSTPDQVFDRTTPLGSRTTVQTMPSSPPAYSSPSSKPRMSTSKETLSSVPGQDPSRKVIRKPRQHTSPPVTRTQTMESQRVPQAILRSMPAHSSRTDVLMPLSAGTLASLVHGYDDAIVLTFRVPESVARFWLYSDDVLSYVACATKGVRQASQQWRYYIEQIYELNDSVSASRIELEEWVKMPLTRYDYLPPAIVGGLLWNLRHALFCDNAEEEQEEQEVHPDLLASSPVKADRSRNSHHPPRTASVLPAQRAISSAGDNYVTASDRSTQSISVSQQVNLQLQSESTQFLGSDRVGSQDEDRVLVPSTPDQDTTAASNVSAPPTHIITSSSPTRQSRAAAAAAAAASRPKTHKESQPCLPRASQASTVSQVSARASSPRTPRAAAPPSAPRRTTNSRSQQESRGSTQSLRRPLLPESSTLHFLPSQDSPPDAIDLSASIVLPQLDSATSQCCKGDGPVLQSRHSQGEGREEDDDIQNDAGTGSGSCDVKSNFLSKSQTLPNSLLRDDFRVPPEM